MTALDKVLRLAGTPDLPRDDPAAGLALAACSAVSQLAILLAKDAEGDDDGDDDSKGGDGGHDSHATYKALIKKGVKPAMAAKMCAKADNKVEACALAESAQVLLAALLEDGLVVELAAAGESKSDRMSLAAKGQALEDGSYPIPDKKHLHSAAVLAVSGHGNVAAAKRLIRKRARELGVELSSLPGFGGSSAKDEKVAATMVALAAGQGQMKGTAAVAHGPYHGVHAHPHVHSGDNIHGAAGPDRVPGESRGW